MISSGELRVIVNPAAGHGTGLRCLGPLREIGKKLRVELRLDVTRYPGHATQLARRAVEAGLETLVVMGGDGTIGEVVNGISESETTLGIIAIGTGNDVARSLELPINNLKRAFEVIQKGQARLIDLGRARGRYFASVLGIGFPTTVAAEANKIKKLGGPAVFLLAMCKSLPKMKAFTAEIRLDNKVLKGRFTSIVIQNTPYTGGGLLIAPDARVDDGELDVVLVDEIGKLNLMWNLPKLYRGRHLGHPSFSVNHSAKIEVVSKQELPAVFDGDLFGTAPLAVCCEKRILRVLATP